MSTPQEIGRTLNPGEEGGWWYGETPIDYADDLRRMVRDSFSETFTVWLRHWTAARPSFKTDMSRADALIWIDREDG